MQRSSEVEEALGQLRTSSEPAAIHTLVEGASEQELSFRPAPGEWSVVEILRHLGDTEDIRQMRFDRMLAEDNPTLDRPAPTSGERDSQDAHVLLARYERLCNLALERLSKLTDEQWQRVGTQLPDPQVNRTVPTPTSVLQESGKVIRHSVDHLQHMQKNLSAFATRAQRA